MIRLRPWLRLYRDGPAADPGARHAFLEAILEERAIPLTTTLHDVVKALGAGPVASSTALLERMPPGTEKGAVHGALSQLAGLKLVVVNDDADDLWSLLTERTPEVPVVDNVELTNICPMSCVMCPTGTGRMTRARHHMDVGTFARVVDSVAPHNNHGKALTLHNLGESALHPALAECVALASRAGLRTEVSANPGHMPVELFIALERAGLSRLVLSVDGVDEETLTRIRGKGARAERAFGYLEDVLRARAAAGGSTHVVLQMVRQRANAAQTDAFLARFGARGIVGVDAYVKEMDANTVDSEDALYEIGRPRRPYLCRAPWRTVVILANGDVVPCCHDANGEVVYGNICDRSLAEIWAGDEVRALRQRMQTGTLSPNEPCAACAHRADRYTLPTLDDVPVEPLHW